MRPKIVVLLVASALLLGAAVGRYTLPARVETITKRQYVTKTVTKRVETRKPDGTVTIVTDRTRGTKDATETDKTVTRSTDRWEVGAMAALRPLKAETPAYGAYVDYRLLGPITVGVWGMSDATIGARVGVRF